MFTFLKKLFASKPVEVAPVPYKVETPAPKAEVVKPKAEKKPAVKAKAARKPKAPKA